MVLDGSMDGAAFLVYVRECVCPTLTHGDSVIADNLASHTVAGVRAAIEAAGATRRDLPPYSPDLTPIEKLFSTLNALLSKAAHRTVDARWTEIGNLLPTFSPDECQLYFASSGYGHTSIENALAPPPVPDQYLPLTRPLRQDDHTESGIIDQTHPGFST